MNGFSSRALGVVQDFAKNIEIGEFILCEDGSVTIEFESAGTLSLTPSQDGARTLVSLKRFRTFLQNDELERFLALSDYDTFLGLWINAGMSADDGLVLVASIDEANLGLHSLEQCLDTLISLHDDWASL